MKLDSEEQREYLLAVLREVPIAVKGVNGQPVAVVTVGNLEDGPPAQMKELLASVRDAECEQ